MDGVGFYKWGRYRTTGLLRINDTYYNQINQKFFFMNNFCCNKTKLKNNSVFINLKLDIRFFIIKLFIEYKISPKSLLTFKIPDSFKK